MRGHEVYLWHGRDNGESVDGLVAREVVGPNVLKIDGLLHPFHLIDLPRPRPQVRVLTQIPTRTLEVLGIHHIESDCRHKQTQIRLGEASPVPGQPPLTSENFLRT